MNERDTAWYYQKQCLDLKDEINMLQNKLDLLKTGEGKEVEINKMLQSIKDAHLDQNAHEYVADPAKAICEALYEAGFRCVDWMLEDEK